MMEKMSLPLDLKGAAERRIEGLGAVFGNRDHGGDIIVPGAFTKTLKSPQNTIRPMLWHDERRKTGLQRFNACADYLAHEAIPPTAGAARHRA